MKNDQAMTNTQNLDAIRKARQFPGFPIRTAVILAAGMGIRLKERGRLMPKGCLRLGEDGGELTGFPDDKFEVQTVLSYLTSERLRAPCEMAKND